MLIKGVRPDSEYMIIHVSEITSAGTQIGLVCVRSCFGTSRKVLDTPVAQTNATSVQTSIQLITDSSLPLTGVVWQDRCS